MSTFSDLCNEIQKEFPKFSLKNKDQSFLMKLIGFHLFVLSFGKQNKFMTGFITTVGYTVYVPQGWASMRESDRCIILRHERVHMRQLRKYTPIFFTFLYLFFPLPFLFAYYRAKFEKEAYEESIRASVEYYGVGVLSRAGFKQRVLDHFLTGEYLWMWPFRKSIETWYESIAKELVVHAMVNHFRPSVPPSTPN